MKGCTSAPSLPGGSAAPSCKRLKPFDVHLHYTDRHRLPEEVERELGATWHESAADMVPHCDVVTINCPLHPETENLFDEAMIARMKRGAYLVNTARGKIADRDAVARALESGQLAGYAGDVWFPQPAPRDHPWRTMPHDGMTPHISGTSLSAQARYAAGTREILECFLEGRPIRDEYLIVQGGHLAGAGAHSLQRGRHHRRFRRCGARSASAKRRRGDRRSLIAAPRPSSGIGATAIRGLARQIGAVEQVEQVAPPPRPGRRRR